MSFHLLRDAVRFLLLGTRSSAALKAENLFLRKQLALYLEPQAKPGRADDATRLALALLSNLFAWNRFEGWFASIEKKALQLGDYSVARLEDACVVERKDLADLDHSCTADRRVFVHRLQRMARYPYRLLVSALSQVKCHILTPGSTRTGSRSF